MVSSQRNSFFWWINCDKKKGRILVVLSNRSCFSPISPSRLPIKVINQLPEWYTPPSNWHYFVMFCSSRPKSEATTLNRHTHKQAHTRTHTILFVCLISAPCCCGSLLQSVVLGNIGSAPNRKEVVDWKQTTAEEKTATEVEKSLRYATLHRLELSGINSS